MCLSSEALERWTVGQQGELLGSKGWCVELQEAIDADPCWGLHIELEGIGPLVCSLLYALIFLFRSFKIDDCQLCLWTNTIFHCAL